MRVRLIENDGPYYVYEHWRPDLNVPFYVGKGKGKRAFVKQGRSAKHKIITELLTQHGLQLEVRFAGTGLGEKQAFVLEQRRIKFWRRKKVELVNLTDGGDGTWGAKYTDERRAKLSRAFKGRTFSVEHCKNMSLAQKDKRLSKQHRKKLSVAGKNKPKSEEHKRKISAALKNKPKSPEHRLKLREFAKLGRLTKRSPEARARMSAAQRKRPPLPPDVKARVAEAISKAQTGRVPSEETRRKMSVSQTGRTHSEAAKQKMREKALVREARRRELGLVQQNQIGRKPSAETILKIRTAAIAREASKKERGVRRGRLPGFTVGEVTRQRLRDAAARRRQLQLGPQ